ncbi:MAG TPA: hypothetical protein VKZ57_13860 [Sphingobacterium sp.]|nr:hypothetical protein [Sphingobacterium sp.]
MNPAGMQKVSKLYQQFLEELGFTTRLRRKMEAVLTGHGIHNFCNPITRVS